MWINVGLHQKTFYDLFEQPVAKNCAILKVAFFQKMRFVFQISKKNMFEITILSLKFEFVDYCYWREI